VTPESREPLLVVGSGIAGLAAALACQRAGWPVRVVDKAAVLSEAGAGIQLGPNAVRLLDSWGLGQGLRARAARPNKLLVHSAARGGLLAELALGDACVQRYGTDYLTVHRADLQALLLQACAAVGIVPELNMAITSVAALPDRVCGSGLNGLKLQAPAWLAADGVWSASRSAVSAAQEPRFTGHWAWRSLLQPADLPASVVPDSISVWLGRRLHVVGYPVRTGTDAAYNLVVLLEARQGAAQASTPATPLLRHWSHQAEAKDLLAQLGSIAPGLHCLLQAAPAWKRWALHDQAALTSPQQMAQGRIALLGDAAHPMLPYLAQGAAMALEDAQSLGDCLSRTTLGNAQHQHTQLPAALQAYAQARWQRCAQVQARAQRNGRLFHYSGLMQYSRDAALRLLGGRLLDVPWLYAGAARHGEP
jgi:salicylate hydroxylase